MNVRSKWRIGLLVTGLAVGGGVATMLYRRPAAVPEPPATAAKSLAVRAERRAYDGAPPVIPHAPLGNPCITCHTTVAREVPGIGLAPPNPHLKTVGLSETSRCQQCHVFQTATTTFVASDFRPLRQSLVHGDRLYPHAPPVVPHHLFMREDCVSCHSGAAGRTEIRCSHPDRENCLQCHATIRPIASVLRAPGR
ncbi:MAG: hypothetical protein U0746_22265 [Gemmataceae bacterium]